MRTVSSARFFRPLRGLRASRGCLVHGLTPVAGDDRPLRGLDAAVRPRFHGLRLVTHAGVVPRAEACHPFGRRRGIARDGLVPAEDLHEYGEVMQIDIAVHLEVEHGAGRIQLRNARAAEAGAKGAEVNEIDVTVLVRIIKRG